MGETEAVILETRAFRVASDGEAIAARRAVKSMVLDSGVDTVFAEEVSLVTSELAFNIARHAGSGQIVVRVLRRGDATGIEIEASDQGRGIADVASSLADGNSTAGGLGLGLGAVNRLMDSLDIVSSEQGVSGTRVRCARWSRTDSSASMDDHAEIGMLSRPKPGETVNGDACLAISDGDTCLLAVIDGVGHGYAAHQAATAVRHYVETHVQEPLERIILGASYGCQSTRGAVMSLVRTNRSSGTLEHAGIGNIETRLFSDGSPRTLVSRRGIVGVGSPRVLVNRLTWRAGDLLAMFSDGLRASWEWTQFPMAALLPAQQFARELFDAHVRENDDATLLIAKYK
jgi:anti-sigma regulatory factor (Ser/Thr protein kinase)